MRIACSCEVNTGKSECLVCEWKFARSIRAIRSDSKNTGRPTVNWINGSADDCIVSRLFWFFCFVPELFLKWSAKLCPIDVYAGCWFNLRGPMWMNAKLATENNADCNRATAREIEWNYSRRTAIIVWRLSPRKICGDTVIVSTHLKLIANHSERMHTNGIDIEFYLHFTRRTRYRIE